MSKRNNRSQKTALALAIAAGRTVAAWARENKVAERTARRWSQSAEVLDQVERIRRRAVDRAVGELTRRAVKAVRGVAKLADSAESEAVRLNANRAIIADMLAVTDHANFERRLAELERRARANATPPQA
jgi:hypothetical protein